MLVERFSEDEAKDETKQQRVRWLFTMRSTADGTTKSGTTDTTKSDTSDTTKPAAVGRAARSKPSAVITVNDVNDRGMLICQPCLKIHMPSNRSSVVP